MMMHPVRKRRVLFIIATLMSAILATLLVLYALGQNINAFYSPTQIVAGEVPEQTLFRVGGIVVADSVIRGDELRVQFALTDEAEVVTVHYDGILPDLFREGQGIVAQGRLNEYGVFIAQEVLAKHDADYMPPEVIHALEQAAA